MGELMDVEPVRLEEEQALIKNNNNVSICVQGAATAGG